MFALLADLKALHDLDQSILAEQTAMAESERGLAAQEAAVSEAEKGLEAVRAQSKDARSREGLKEVDLKAVEQQIESWTVKLNTTRDNKEYQGISHQIETLKAQKGTLEEEILGMMDAGAGVQTHVKQEEVHAREVHARCGAVRKEHASAVQVRRAALEALTAKRGMLSASVPEDVLTRYERIRIHRKGSALAEAAGGSCQACYLAMSPNQPNQLKQDRELVLCQGCGRILYTTA